MKQKRKYLLPCRGFVSSRKKIMCLPDEITADSRDVVVVPEDGRLVGRNGTVLQGDIPYAIAGLLETSWSPRCRGLYSLASPTLTDGYPTHAALFTKEGTSGRYGTFYLRNTNTSAGGASNWQFGKEYGSIHYPADNNLAHYKVIPVPVSTGNASGGSTYGAMGMTRGVTSLGRTLFCAGSRSVVESARWMMFPNLYGMPIRWNKLFNRDTANGTQLVRIQPWGNMPPLFPPFVSTGTAAGTDTSRFNWRDGDAFYASVMFQFEDGSFSQPFAIRPTISSGGVLSSDHSGFCQIGTPRTTAGSILYYQNVVWNGIPIGPEGTVARILLRTLKANLSTTTATNPTNGVQGGGQSIADIPASGLRVVAGGIIRNNTQTTFTDTNANDVSLTPDDGRTIRYDNIWAPAARYCCASQQRVVSQYSRLNPAAIVIAPTAGNAGTARERNVGDNSLPGTAGFSVRVVSGQLQLNYFNTGAGTTHYPCVPAMTPITITSGVTTLQDLLDQINQTTPLSTGGEWAAQLAPGADGNALAENLMQTDFTVAGCTSSGSTLTSSGGFANVAVGMTAKFGASVGQVTDKAGDSSITLDANLGAANSTVEFYINAGDDATLSTNTLGNLRAFFPSFPIVLPFKSSYLEALPHYENKRDLWFTVGSPQTPTLGSGQFVATNRRAVDAGAGIGMGVAPYAKGTICTYSRAIHTLENRRGGTTGEDFDFHPYVLNQNRGNIAPGSLFSSHGCVGYLTVDGLMVTDGEREVLISADPYESGQQQGEWATAINQCVAGAESDGDADNFFCSVVGARLNVCYTTDGSTLQRIIYDFSASSEKSGLAAFLDPQGRPFGWSAPLTTALMQIVSVGKSTGAVLYGALASPTVNPERIYRIDTGALDDTKSNTVSGLLLTAGSGTITGAVGAFASIAVGATLNAATKGTVTIAAGATIQSKNATESSVVVSPVLGGSGTASGQSLNFFGQEIEPIAYCTMDMLGNLKSKKVCHNVTALHLDSGLTTGPGSVTTLYHSADKARSGQTSYPLTRSGAGVEHLREVIELTQAARTPGEVVELAWGHNGSARGATPPTLWGFVAEVDETDALV